MDHSRGGGGGGGVGMSGKDNVLVPGEWGVYMR